MEIISLGGVGGCILAESLRDMNMVTYPFDWLITTQSFVIDSIENSDNFFIFEKEYVYNESYLLAEKKNAIMLHDFNDFVSEKENVIAKYDRRMNRLKEVFRSKKDVLFVRLMDNLSVPLSPLNFYDDVFVRETESISKWKEFMKSKRGRLLLITTEDIDEEEGLIIRKCESFTKESISYFIKEIV